MIRNQSKLTCEISEQTVKLDLIKKGWQTIDAPPECPFDLLIDKGIGDDGRRIIETVQVKSENSDPWTKSRSGRGSDTYGPNHKQRNTHNYYDEGIDWLAVPIGNEVHYWSKEQYRYKTKGEVKKTTPTNFPSNQVTLYGTSNDVETEYNILNMLCAE